MQAKTFLTLALLAVATVRCSDSTSSSDLCSGMGASAVVTATDANTFNPGTVTITHGQSVCWQNTGTVLHTVTDNATNGTLFGTSISASQTFVHPFPNAGTFPYHCNIHFGMTGTVVVN